MRILKSLNEKQKSDVRQLGFGGLLDYDVTSILMTLAYGLLENFNHLQCSLKLPNGGEVGIDDVELVFGFPDGGIEFEQMWRNDGHQILRNHPT